MVRKRKILQRINIDKCTTSAAEKITASSSKPDNISTRKDVEEKKSKRSSMLFLVIFIEMVLMLLFLLFQGDKVKYFSELDLRSVQNDVGVGLKDEISSKRKDSKSVSRHAMKKGSYRVLETYYHDSQSFTQGLTYFDGYVYESTGIYGKSSIRQLDPHNNFTTIHEVKIDSNFFGEGMTHYKSSEGDDLFLVLTWKEKTAFVYDKQLNLIGSFSYHTQTGEGWGITFDSNSNQFIASDGSEYLYFFSLSTSQENKKIKIHGYLEDDSDEIVFKLINELEFVSPKDGSSPFVLANIWMQNYILQIDPQSGRIITLYDLSDLCPERKFSGENVLNGISVTGAVDHSIVYITGKLWDKMYKIKLLP